MFNLQFLVLGAVLLAITWIARELYYGLQKRNGPKLDFPIVGSPGDSSYTAAIIEGYKKYPDSPFTIPTNPPLVILPMSIYLESKSHPSASFNAESYERFMGRWTHVGNKREEVLPTIRQDLTKSIASILPLIQDETQYAFETELGRPADWTPVPLYPKMLRMVALLSGRVFVGYPLNRSEEWLDASINYTTALAAVMRDYTAWDPLLIPFVAPFLGSVRRVRMYLRKAQKWMGPLVEEILSQETEKSGPIKAGTRGTFISWLLNYLPEEYKTPERIGSDQMLISFAAIHTTSMTGTMVLLDLATRPQHIPELREEIESVLAEDGQDIDENGHLFIRKSTFAKMRKLDSFIKESQRYNGLGLSTPARKLTEDATFSNGLKLPKGTRIGFPTYAINMDSDNVVLSPDYNAQTGNPGPEVFDGFRFSRLRDVPGRETKHQSVTTGLDNLVFGHGPHACPGRFFAIYEIKSLLIEILRNYEIRLSGDVDMKGRAETPRLRTKLQTIPDPRAIVEMRKRAVKA